MKRVTHCSVCTVAVGVLGVVAAAGPDWTEVGDAGGFFNTAQVPGGVGDIFSIAGELGGEGSTADFEDMYVIGVDEPGAFRLDLASADFDAQLFVFNITLSGGLLGLLGNDDAGPGTTNPLLTPISTDGSGAVLDLPGDYLICVTGKGRNPTSVGGLIFDLQDPFEISGPDGPGGVLRHTGWEGVGETGSYNIVMDGTIFPSIPAPSAAVVLGLAGLGVLRRVR